MKCLLLGSIALSIHAVIATPSRIHIDISENGDIAVDIDDNKASSTRPKLERVNKPIYPLRDTAHVLEKYEVDLDYEIHSGFLSDNEKFVTFKNIPYAEPPTDENRFLEPIPIQSVREGVNDGSRSAVCPQAQVGWAPKALEFMLDFKNISALFKWRNPITEDDYGAIQYPPGQEVSEDCLLLDVMVPKSVWEKRNSRTIGAAVVFWIHGGGFIYGWKDQYGSPEGLFDAATKDDEQNIIYVAMNYRLGAFGWLGGPKYQEQGGRSNVGLLDQAFAMKWVKQNIHLFGGASNRVSMMGQSAGASSILHHITAYGGNSRNTPQMQGAIIQSPGFFPQPNSTKDDETYDTFLKLAKADDLDALLKADTKILQDVNAKMTHESKYGYFNFGPTIDHDYVPDLPGKILLNNKLSFPAMLLGHMKLDGLLFTPPWIRTTNALLEHVKQLFPGVPSSVLERIKKDYPITSLLNPQGALLKVADFLDDIAIQCNNYYLTEASLNSNARTYHPVYRYSFNALPAVHGYDTGYTYYPSPPLIPGVDPTLAQSFQKSIVDFARYMDPNLEDSNLWEQYKTDNRKVLNMGDPKQFLLPNYNISLGDDLMDLEKCKYWQTAPYYTSDTASRAKFVVQGGKMSEDL